MVRPSAGCSCPTIVGSTRRVAPATGASPSFTSMTKVLSYLCGGAGAELTRTKVSLPASPILLIPAVKVSSSPVQLSLLGSTPPLPSSELLQQLTKAAERVITDKGNREPRIELSRTVAGASGRPQLPARLPSKYGARCRRL